MKPPALLLMTMAKLPPERVWEALQVYKEWATPQDRLEITGCCQMLVVESQDEPGSLIWISTWYRLADSQAFLSSPGYADLLSILRPFLLRKPEWYRYSILQESMTQQE
jgi:quinol monooxygenase YgiN